MKSLAFRLGLFPALFALAAARAATPEAAPVAALDEALLATMKAGSAHASFAARYAALDPVVKRSLDLPVLLRNSVGIYWSTVPAAQQATLAGLFERFTVASYINGFGGYGGQRIDILPAERGLGAEKIVETEIVPADGTAPTRLDYVMADGPAGWQATDVLLGGTISKVAVQASDYSSLVASGDASRLIAALNSKISNLSNGG